MAKSNFDFIIAKMTQDEISRLTGEMLDVVSVGGVIRAIDQAELTAEQIKLLNTNTHENPDDKA